MDIGRRNRTASALDLDDMLGFIMDGLRNLNVMENTYLIFTSDNGFHLGEHQFFYGKERPYEHDVRVPMLIHTPQVLTGVRTLPTTHVDITRTIVDIAQAQDLVSPSLSELDGKSFFTALTGEDVPISEWRSFSYSELFEPEGRTWRYIRHFAEDGKLEWTLSLWCSGEVEVFDMADDNEQLKNLLEPKTAANTFRIKVAEFVKQQWLPVINGIGSCSGRNCSEASKLHRIEGLDDLSTLLPCATFDKMEGRNSAAMRPK